MRRKLLMSVLLGVVPTLLLVAGVTFSRWHPPDRVDTLDDLLTDSFWTYRNDSGQGPDYEASARQVLVVTIDSDSLRSQPGLKGVGPWPWPRSTFATFARLATRAGARVVAFDFPMLNPGQGDRQMAAEFNRNPAVVLADAWWPGSTGKLRLRQPFWWLRGKNAVDYHANADRIGFTSAYVGTQGVLRRVYLVYPGKDRVLLSFDLAVAMDALQDTDLKGMIGNLFDKNNFVDSFVFGNRRVPLDDGAFTINYDLRTGATSAGTGSLLDGGVACYAPHRSFKKLWRLCQPDAPGGLAALARVVKGKVLLVGITAIDLKDRRGTPLGVSVAPVYIHADILASLLEGRFMHKLPAEYRVLIIFLAGLLVSVILPQVDQLKGLVGVLLLAVSYYFAARWVFVHNHLILPLFPPILALMLPLGFMSWWVNHINERDKALVRNLFGGYLSPKVVDNLIRLKDQGKLGLHGRKLKLTMFYSDIRGFTAMSERLDPYQVVSLLNEHFDHVTRIAYRHDAYVDKFIGDSLMAVFSAPTPRPDDALRAVRMALEMMADMENLNRDRNRRGDPTYRVGMAVHTAPVVLGNIGSSVKMDYTVIGDGVNLTSRLCGAAGPGQILISQATYEEVKDHVEVNELTPLSLKGKAEPVIVYEVTGLKSAPGLP